MYIKPFNIEMESHEKSMKILNINLKFRSLSDEMTLKSSVFMRVASIFA